MTNEHFTLKQYMLCFTEYNTEIRVFPVLVESCMNPGQFRLYPVEVSINREKHIVSIQSLQGKWQIDYEKTPITFSSFTPKQPSRKGCDGNCDTCRKCC